MKTILITQRRDVIQNRDEIRDCLDVRWSKILYEMKLLPIPVCSELANEKEYVSHLKPDGILLSGGNSLGVAAKRDTLEYALLDYAKDHNTPVLGVCRGMQFINHYFGGYLVNVEGHVSNYKKLYGEWSDNLGYGYVNSYHKQAIKKETLATPLESIAESKDGVIKALKHKKLPWFGIMWHPERELSIQHSDKKLLTKLFVES